MGKFKTGKRISIKLEPPGTADKVVPAMASLCTTAAITRGNEREYVNAMVE